MRVLNISALYPPAIGGAENYVQSLSEGLAKAGEDVSVFTANALHSEDFTRLGFFRNLPKEETVKGVHIRRFPVNTFANFLCSHKTDKIRGAYRLKDLLLKDTAGFWEHGPVIDDLLEEIRAHKPDVMIAVNNYSWTTYLAYLARQRLDIPLVVVPLSHVANAWTNAPILQKIYATADAVVVSTTFERDYLINQGALPGLIKVLGHGIDPAEFAGADAKRFRDKHGVPEKPVVSFVGRKVNGKGVEMLVAAMRLVWQKEPDAQLVLAGTSSDYFNPVLQGQIDLLDVDERERTFNINSFRDEEKKDIFAASSIFVMPSNVDSFGLVYLEAWCNRLPVIACFNTPQESFMAHQKDALLVEYGNIESLAQAIISLLRNPVWMARMGANGREKFERAHTLDIYIEGMRRICQDILGVSGHEAPSAILDRIALE